MSKQVLVLFTRVPTRLGRRQSTPVAGYLSGLTGDLAATIATDGRTRESGMDMEKGVA
jgi:hypothetical protein